MKQVQQKQKAVSNRQTTAKTKGAGKSEKGAQRGADRVIKQLSDVEAAMKQRLAHMEQSSIQREAQEENDMSQQLLGMRKREAFRLHNPNLTHLYAIDSTRI